MCPGCESSPKVVAELQHRNQMHHELTAKGTKQIGGSSLALLGVHAFGSAKTVFIFFNRILSIWLFCAAPVLWLLSDIFSNAGHVAQMMKTLEMWCCSPVYLVASTTLIGCRATSSAQHARDMADLWCSLPASPQVAHAKPDRIAVSMSKTVCTHWLCFASIIIRTNLFTSN